MIFSALFPWQNYRIRADTTISTGIDCKTKRFISLLYPLRNRLSTDCKQNALFCADFNIFRALNIQFSVNGIFAVVFLICTALFLFHDPEGFLPALIAGGQKAATLSLSLLAVYCVWLGFFKVLEKSGLAQKLAGGVYPLARKLFRTEDKEAISLASGNLTANFLGLPGAPTPLGMRAIQKFCAAQNRYAADMLFVLNATSLQLLPTTVIALRLAAGSASAADILLPTLIATLFSTVVGALGVWLFHRPLKRHGNAKRKKRRTR